MSIVYCIDARVDPTNEISVCFGSRDVEVFLLWFVTAVATTRGGVAQGRGRDPQQGWDDFPHRVRC